MYRDRKKGSAFRKQILACNTQMLLFMGEIKTATTTTQQTILKLPGKD